jgi:rhodanese-related sulfurtransferase
MATIEIGHLKFGLENSGFERHLGTNRKAGLSQNGAGYNQHFLIMEPAMRKLLLLFLALTALTARADVVDIGNVETERLLKSGVTIIDIRTQPEWEETGILPGSHLITFFDERGRADPAAWLDKVKPFAKPGDPVIVICRSGNRTKAVSQFLAKQAGYSTVYNVKDGIRGWQREKYPVVPAAPVLAACRSNRTC